MKKLILFSVLMLMMSCSDTDFTSNNQQADSCGRPSKVCRSESEAIQIANDFAESINLSTRSKTRRASSENLGYILDSHSRTTIDTIMYVVHYHDNEGFALIARNPEATPVIAVIDSGQYNPNDISDNQGFNDFIECARAYAITPTDSIYDKPIPVPISYSNSYHINPVLEVEWGQNYPEGIYCPNGISGCVQTALAQMMSYLEAPSFIKLTYPSRDANIQELNWTELKKHKQSCNSTDFVVEWHKQTCAATEETHTALGRLCRELGHRNAATYNTDNTTGALSKNALATMKSLLPEYTITDFKYHSPYTIYDYIKTNYAIVYYEGFTGINGEGHAWVCDGAHYYHLHSGIPLAGGGNDITEIYMHFNWGWNGSYNGYFLAEVYNTAKGTPDDRLPEGDFSQSRSDFSYNVKQFAIYKPK